MRWPPGPERPPRIGSRMLEVTGYVAGHPGCPKIGPASEVAPRGENGVGLRFGYAAVDRAMRAGLVEDCSGDQHYRLYVTGKGRAELEARG